MIKFNTDEILEASFNDEELDVTSPEGSVSEGKSKRKRPSQTKEEKALLKKRDSRESSALYRQRQKADREAAAQEIEDLRAKNKKSEQKLAALSATTIQLQHEIEEHHALADQLTANMQTMFSRLSAVIAKLENENEALRTQLNIGLEQDLHLTRALFSFNPENSEADTSWEQPALSLSDLGLKLSQ